MPFPKNAFTPPPQLSAHTTSQVPGAAFANPEADKINKKRKKYQLNPSMAGLKSAASNAPKPFMSEGKPGAGVGGNV